MNERTNVHSFVSYFNCTEKLGVRCEHFSPSKSTETFWTMANVFIFHSFTVEGNSHYMKIHTLHSTWVDFCLVQSVQSIHTPCIVLVDVRFVYPCIVSTKEKPAPVWMGNWMSVWVHLISYQFFLYDRSRLWSALHIEPTLSQYLLGHGE